MSIYQIISDNKEKGKKQFVVLVDPDKQNSEDVRDLALQAEKAKVDFFFVGGSLLTHNTLEACIKEIKNNSSIPVILFPGDNFQINNNADAILFLSVISGRNAEMLIGKHVVAAPFLKRSTLEIMSTGYMLIDSGRTTTALYMSNTFPIPADKPDIAACTAIAGEMLGLKLIYLDGGSGATNPVSPEMIKTVKANISVPLIVGGGIKTPEKALENCKAGADLIVIGNAIEKKSQLLSEISEAIFSLK